MIFFTDYTLEMFEYIKGLHTLLEYIDNDKRYVLFSLFGSFWYKVEICKNFDSNAKLEHLEQYSLDSKIRISNSNAVAFNLDISNSTIKQVKREFFKKPNSVKIYKLKIERASKFINKLEEILFGVVLTIPEITNQLIILEKDKIF